MGKETDPTHEGRDWMAPSTAETAKDPQEQNAVSIDEIRAAVAEELEQARYQLENAEPWDESSARNQVYRLENQISALDRGEISSHDLESLTDAVRNKRVQAAEAREIERQFEENRQTIERERQQHIATEEVLQSIASRDRAQEAPQEQWTQEQWTSEYARLKEESQRNFTGRTQDESRDLNRRRQEAHYKAFGHEEGVSPDWNPDAMRAEGEHQRQRGLEAQRVRDRQLREAPDTTPRPTREQIQRSYQESTPYRRQQRKEADRHSDRTDIGL